MAQTIATFDTAHAGTLHDAQLDYYGKRLATASSDHTVRLWDVSSEVPTYLAELSGHEGPVWQVCWAHPKFGNILASCSYDKRVIIWREVRYGEWQVVYRCEDHAASVNSVDWCPWEFGLQLACGSSDGTVSVLMHRADNSWTRKSFQAHANGVNAVGWAPAATTVVLSGGLGGGLSVGAAKLVTGGCDNQVRIWRFEESTSEWLEIHQMTDKPHSDWVRDVAWRPNVGVPSNVIASCAEDETVIFWVQEEEGQAWRNAQCLHLGAPVWRVSWSVTGTVLAVASGDNHVSLFKEAVDGKWEKVTNLSDQSSSMSASPSPIGNGTNGPTNPPRLASPSTAFSSTAATASSISADGWMNKSTLPAGEAIGEAPGRRNPFESTRPPPNTAGLLAAGAGGSTHDPTSTLTNGYTHRNAQPTQPPMGSSNANPVPLLSPSSYHQTNSVLTPSPTSAFNHPSATYANQPSGMHGIGSAFQSSPTPPTYAGNIGRTIGGVSPPQQASNAFLGGTARPPRIDAGRIARIQ